MNYEYTWLGHVTVSQVILFGVSFGNNFPPQHTRIYRFRTRLTRGKSNQNTGVRNFSPFFIALSLSLLVIHELLVRRSFCPSHLPWDRSLTAYYTNTHFYRNTIFVAVKSYGTARRGGGCEVTCPAPSVRVGPVPFTRKIPGIRSKIHKRPKFRRRSLSFNCFSQLAVDKTLKRISV